MNWSLFTALTELEIVMSAFVTIGVVAFRLLCGGVWR